MSAGRYNTVILKNDGTTAVYGHVNPFDALNGSAAIVVRNNTIYSLISFTVVDRNNTEILSRGDPIIKGGPDYKVSLKPGVYNLSCYINGIKWSFPNVTLAENEIKILNVN